MKKPSSILRNYGFLKYHFSNLGTVYFIFSMIVFLNYCIFNNILVQNNCFLESISHFLGFLDLNFSFFSSNFSLYIILSAYFILFSPFRVIRLPIIITVFMRK